MGKPLSVAGAVGAIIIVATMFAVIWMVMP